MISEALPTGPWVIRAGGETDRGGGWSSGLWIHSLHMKSVLLGAVFTISRNWLIQGGAAPPEPAGPQIVKASKIHHKVI